MKNSLCAFALFAFFSLVSCVQDEPANSECDIEEARVLASDVEALFFTPNEAVMEVASADTSIVFYLREDFTDSAQLRAVKMDFKLTPGATVTPANGSVQDFTNGGIDYRVTSEDRQWHRDYHVRFALIRPIETSLSFEHVRLEASKGRYYEWFEKSAHGNNVSQWATGNPGFAISRSSAKLDDFPTLPWTEDAISGQSVKLETRDTGPFGVMVNMRIAAGNLFIGTFDVANALKDAMAATHFGLPFNKKPIRFKGYYKFKPGEKFQNRKGTIIEGRIDEPDLYAVLYKNTDEQGQPVTLKGDDVLTHPNIVALARVKNPVHDFNTWTHFDEPFEPFDYDLDVKLLRDYGYNLAVVFTSSIEGASFCGAVGSTLLVDEVEVVCEE